MRETPKAKEAFNDYLAMGEGRSLPKLAERYRTTIESPPTRQVSRLLIWSAQHAWQARLAEIAEQERTAIVVRGITEKQNRLDSYNERWATLRAGVEAWADEYKNAPGGAKSGYYARKIAVVKVLGEFETDAKGRSRFVPMGEQQEVEEWALDIGLLKELRELEKQAAVEMEQWTEKHDHKIDLSGLSNGELDQLEHLVSKIAKS